jgi:Ras-related protein Rab-27A
MKYRDINRSFYDNVDGILLIFDITNEDTFLNLENWISEIRTHFIKIPKIILIGNKLDLM